MRQMETLLRLHRNAWLASLALLLPLSACGTTGSRAVQTTPSSSSSVTLPPVRQPVVRQPTGPKVHMAPGLEGVIGADAAQLVRQFGPARLDVHEGDARKLQFTGSTCVLDIYLYPLRDRAEPTATYVEARQAANGREVDRAACVAALKGR